MASTMRVSKGAKPHGSMAEMMPRPPAALDAPPRTFSAAVTATRGRGLGWRWPPGAEMPPTYPRFALAIATALGLP
jgi:hypothetical protein